MKILKSGHWEIVELRTGQSPNLQSTKCFDSWLDMRCQPYIEYREQNHGNLITPLTGCLPTCYHGSKIVWWKEEQPEAYARIAKFITPAGYVAGTMAGLSAANAFKVT